MSHLRRATRARRRTAAPLQYLSREISPDASAASAALDASAQSQELGDDATQDRSNKMEDDLGPITQIMALPFAPPPMLHLGDDGELVLANLRGLVAAAGFEVD